MKKHNLAGVVCGFAVFTLIGLATSMVKADNQIQPFTPKPGGSGSSCPGTYFGWVKLTNGTATSLYWTPPTNATSGTLTDVSGYGSPYVSVACVTSTAMGSWCGTNSVTFPVTNSAKYTLTIYVKSSPPPTNGQPISASITWQ
jgi:hypothetical protein